MLTQQDFVDGAETLGCHPAALQAVAFVESSGSGFCPDNFPKILFEGHYFSKLTKGKYDQSHPTISYPKWTRVHYGKGWQAERARLDTALSLNRPAAIRSASWGAFQIMGEHFKRCGFETPQEFLNAMCADENSQLEIFINFILSDRKLLTAIQDQDWMTFSYFFNGPAFKTNKYDEKMSDAFTKYVLADISSTTDGFE
jgi:hypothetical protein